MLSLHQIHFNGGGRMGIEERSNGTPSTRRLSFGLLSSFLLCGSLFLPSYPGGQPFWELLGVSRPAIYLPVFFPGVVGLVLLSIQLASRDKGLFRSLHLCLSPLISVYVTK